VKFDIVRIVVRKELTEARRDLRSIVLLALLPALVYPSLLFLVARLGSAGGEKLNRIELVVIEEPGLPGEVRTALEEVTGITLVKDDDTRASDADARIGVSAEDAEKDLAKRTVTITVDRATERGATAERRLLPALEDARQEARDGRLRALGIDDDTIAIAPVTVIDTAPPARKGGFLLSRGIVPILILMILMGAYYPAVETTVGERERQTLRTLLCAPIDATSIALGKLVVVSLLALVAGIANLFGLAFTARLGLMAQAGFTIPLSAIALTVVLLVPLAILMAAILMATASLARTSREAQTLLTPLTLVVTIPAIAPSFPGIEATPEKALVPIFGIALTIRELLGGTATTAMVAAALVGGVVLVVAALYLASRAFTVEALLTGRVAMPLRSTGPLELFDAILLALSLVAVLVLSGSALSGLDPIVSVVGVQLLTFLGVPLVFVAIRSRAPRDALGLLAPSRGSPLLVAGACLLLPTFGAVGARFAQHTLGEDELEQFRGLAERMESLPSALLFVIFALLPAVVEEIAFRGALQRAFAKHIRFHAVWVTAIFFALMHGSIARTVPTLLVGLLAGGVAYVSRSTLTSMIVHAAHNGFALALGVFIAEQVGDTWSGDPYRALPMWVHVLVAPGVICIALGIRNVRAHQRGASPHAPPAQTPLE
jgi:sodium transport system permease protein